MSEVFTGHFALAVKEGNLPKAYEVIEEPRGRVAADGLWADATIAASPRSAEIMAAERKLALLQMKLSEVTGERAQAKILEQIAEVENEIPIPPQQPLENVPWRRPLLGDLQGVISANETLLEYVIGDESSYCLVISRDSIRVVHLPARAVIDDRVDRFLSVIAKERKVKAEAHELYAAVLKPILDAGATNTLVIIPDGSLYRVPFTALIDDQGHYLLESRTIKLPPFGHSF